MASSPTGSSDPWLFDHFVGMGFPENMVAKALKENSDGNVDLILEHLLASKAPGSSPQEQQSADSDCLSSDSEGSLYEECTDIDSSESEMSMNFLSQDNKKLIPLVEMGYSMDEAFIAYERCGPDATLAELADFICAAQLEKEEDARLGPLPEVKASSPTGSSDPRLFDHFVGMGFPENMVAKALKENSNGNVDLILEYLLASKAPGSSPQEQQSADSNCLSSDSEGSFYEERTDIDSSETEMSMNFLSEDNKKLIPLVEMGYSMDEAFIAYERCGPDATLAELADFICAAQLAKEEDARLGPLPEVKQRSLADLKKRKSVSGAHERKAQRRCQKDPSTEDEENIRLPNRMIGFGVPNESYNVVNRRLPKVVMGPPYFYYENVALAPKGVWDTISRFLYEIEPEFVDSKYFCAAARKRGYVHNLPINNRFPLLPLPPQTIHEALPMTKRWWPSWDTRTKFNCLMTSVGSAKLTERIWKALEQYNGEPPASVQKYVIEECRKWNLVWVGRNKAAPLEPDEVEMLLGFPRNHTRGGGISRTDRYKSLGNSFQVDTVAYHLSVLKDLYPKGINVLSLFSGIGGAEVALHRLGIPLKNVVSVEISEVNRNIMRSWWEQTNQKGNLVDIADIQQVDDARLGHLMDAFGGFDLVVGGSPCNNLTGNNRYTRDGLEGKESSLFFDYFRILDSIMSRCRC